MASVLYDGLHPILARATDISRLKKSSDAYIWIDISQYPESKIPIGLSRKENTPRINCIRSRQRTDTILKPNPNNALLPGTWRRLNPLATIAVSPLPNIQIEKCS